jgi:hypothetical protein
MSGLLDRYRNDDLAIALSDTSPRNDSDRFHSLAAHTERMRRALEHLYSVCVTEEARDSFVRFQMQYASSQNLPELSRPILARWPMPAANASKSVPQDIGIGVGGGPPLSEMNSPKSGNFKISLLNRMLGRREKRESHG